MYCLTIKYKSYTPYKTLESMAKSSFNREVSIRHVEKLIELVINSTAKVLIMYIVYKQKTQLQNLLRTSSKSVILYRELTPTKRTSE